MLRAPRYLNPPLVVCSSKIFLAMIFNEIECHVNTCHVNRSGRRGMHHLHPPLCPQLITTMDLRVFDVSLGSFHHRQGPPLVWETTDLSKTQKNRQNGQGNEPKEDKHRLTYKVVLNSILSKKNFNKKITFKQCMKFSSTCFK